MRLPQGEVKHKYSQEMFQLFTEVFHCLPLAYVLSEKVGHIILSLFLLRTSQCLLALGFHFISETFSFCGLQVIVLHGGLFSKVARGITSPSALWTKTWPPPIWPVCVQWPSTPF